MEDVRQELDRVKSTKKELESELRSKLLFVK
jgi:hypothetical protein